MAKPKPAFLISGHARGGAALVRARARHIRTSNSVWKSAPDEMLKSDRSYQHNNRFRPKSPSRCLLRIRILRQNSPTQSSRARKRISDLPLRPHTTNIRAHLQVRLENQRSVPAWSLESQILSRRDEDVFPSLPIRNDTTVRSARLVPGRIVLLDRNMCV